MRQKIIATGAGLVLVGFASVGAFAAQHATTTLEPVTPTGTVTDTDTVTVTDTPTDTDTPEATETDTPTPEATNTEASEATSTSESGEGSGQRDIKGIPTDNPGKGHRDGLCVKTTPSGNKVRVPCHAHGAGG